jgi:hypothetical protein
MNESLFQTPVDVTDVRLTRNRGAIIKLETEEDMDDSTIAKLSSYVGNRGWFFLGVERIDASDVNPPPLTEQKGKKTKSKILRDKLWRLGQVRGIPKAGEEDFYNEQMDKVISAVQQKIDYETDPTSSS